MTGKPLIVLSGPTAVGKTALSIALAHAVNGSIISADSMQVYKYMDIGSAKIMRSEMDGIKHYLIDELMPEEEFNIVRFQNMAKAAIDEIYNEGKIPIVVGGTGFYIQSLIYDIDFAQQDADDSYRKELEEYAATYGNEALHERLKEIDPISYDTIHFNNVKRVIRALEYYHQTNAPISAHNEEERQKISPYNFAYFVLTDDRDVIYDRINRRVDIMVEKGLLDEVSKLKEMGYHKGMVSMQGLGYKEILSYLNGEITLEEAIYILKRETRHFAKRQLTWFRREREVNWMDKSLYQQDEKAILDAMLSILREKNIIS